MGVLDGLKVLDLSTGVAGPMTAMLLGDHGAAVIRIERPGGETLPEPSGYRVWHRGKRRCTLDLTDPDDRAVLHALARDADVVVESYRPSTAARLGADHRTLRALNPRLIHCTISGYGLDTQDAERPAIDALVAARTGQMWEARGIEGGTLKLLAGLPDPLAEVDPPAELREGAARPGPLFPGVPWASLGAFYLASIAINAALVVRERRGIGQHVHTSLLQGALVTASWPWQRAEHADAPGYDSWVIDPRAPKGFFRCADGKWIHQWTPLPAFMLGSSRGDHLEVTEEVTSPRKAGMRISFDPADMLILHHYIPEMAAAARKFRADDWVEFAAQVGVPLQRVRPPEEALDDPLLIADGCVTEVRDADLGPLRQVGNVYSLSACPNQLPSFVASAGADTDDIRAEARAASGEVATTATATDGDDSDRRPPLDGVLVLDLGLAAAGPFGAQVLGELGADVVKVHQMTDGYWLGTHIGMACNRGKRSLAIDLKQPLGLEALHRLVERADIVHTNMRYEAAQRLGVDYESLRARKPDLIYCHTRGFERGPRDALPGNDQTGAALAGTGWVEGGLDDDGRPIWPNIALGDTGNGLLSAVACIQALLHRDRTGEGQLVETSIIYAHLLNTSMAWKSPDGTHVAARPSLDAMQLGWDALYRLYQTADGWVCVAALTEETWEALAKALGRPELTTDERFSSEDGRRAHRVELGSVLEPIFSAQSSDEWQRVLDAAGVPAETTSERSVVRLFDDPDAHERGWIAESRHPVIGRVENPGILFDFSGTPSRAAGAAPVVGSHSREVLRELGYTDDAIDGMVAAGLVLDASRD